MGRIPHAAFLVAAILVAILLSAGCTKEGPQTGSLEITSTPGGTQVQVFLDGNFQGETPLVLVNLSASAHLLQLSSRGYADKVSIVTITAGQRMHISADYPPLPTPAPETPVTPPTGGATQGPSIVPTAFPETLPPLGALYVTSFPSGATIYLDGRGYGTTPKLVRNLTPKTYELRVSLVGWKDHKVEISVSPGLTTTEAVILSN
jgi:hypothetical protein